MKTLNVNYSRNIAILKENLKRGMTYSQAKKIIDSMESQFVNAGLYGKQEKDFINDMRTVLVNAFTNVEIVNIH